MSKNRIAGIVLLIAVALALAPFVRPHADISIPEHHLLHGVIIAVAALAGILFAGSSARARPAAAGWLIVAMIAPVFAMILMWPSKYSYFEAHVYSHVAEHLGLLVLGFVTGYAGQRYAAGIGWAAGISVVAMAVLSAWGYGVAPATAAPQIAAAPSATAGAPNVARGAAIFAQNCAACHGASGGGGAGPSLKDERTRKSLVQAEQWIENPSSPMPKLYPGTLSAQDVANVAGYVETLH